MELGLGVWMDFEGVRSERMVSKLWTARVYYNDLHRCGSNTHLRYLIVL